MPPYSALLLPRSARRRGYVKREEYELQFADVFDQIVAYAAGTPINVVYPRALQRASERR
jgi:D-3-phosphoglycerate dehydrogenase / 2-oxoglutarate reductase